MKTITFDNSSRGFVYDLIKSAVKDKHCPFCDTWVNQEKFTAGFHYDGEPRMLCDNFVCLISFAAYERGQYATVKVQKKG